MSEENPSPEAKRKKVFSRIEIEKKLKENDQKVKDVAEDIVKEMCPFDLNDEDTVMMEDRLERLKKTTENLVS